MSDLQIERDDRFVAHERLTHRVAIVAMVLMVLGGALGVFGFGPLASATGRGEGFTVSYERFARNGAPLQVTVELHRSGPRRVWIDDAVLEAMQLEQVVPMATSEQATTAGTRFRFSGSGGGAIATFVLTGDDVGLVRGRVGSSAADAIPIWILLYP